MGDTLAVETWPIERLTANPENYRSHPDEQLDHLRESLRSFGWYKNVVATAEGVVLAGHGIVAAAKAEGMAAVPVYVYRGDEAGARKLMVADNEASRLAQDDPDQLSQLLEAIRADSETGLQGTGHDDESLTALLEEVAGQAAPTGFVQEDEDPGEPPVDPVTKPGDVWVMGRHRLVCGDSTDPANYAGCAPVQLVATSPPYAEQRQYELDAFDWDGVVPLVIATACERLVPDGSALVNLGLVHKDGRVVEYWRSLFDMMEAQGRPLFGWYVWDKLDGMPGDWNGRLSPAHEWVFHFAKQPRRADKTKDCKHAGVVPVTPGFRRPDGEFSGYSHIGRQVQSHKVPDSVIRCAPAKGGVEGHPAPFSVEFAAELVSPYTRPGEVVADPFLGSGTTLIAAEQLGRVCYGIEIEPRYCDIAVLRWQKLTNQRAILESTGEPFPETS